MIETVGDAGTRNADTIKSLELALKFLESKVRSYERYLKCDYSHDFQFIYGNDYLCNKCGYSRGALSLRE